MRGAIPDLGWLDDTVRDLWQLESAYLDEVWDRDALSLASGEDILAEIFRARVGVKNITTPVAAHIDKGGADVSGPVVVPLNPFPTSAAFTRATTPVSRRKLAPTGVDGEIGRQRRSAADFAEPTGIGRPPRPAAPSGHRQCPQFAAPPRPTAESVDPALSRPRGNPEPRQPSRSARTVATVSASAAVLSSRYRFTRAKRSAIPDG